LNPEDLKTIRAHRSDDLPQAKIILSKGKKEIGEKFSRFCEQLQREAPHVTIKKDSDIAFEDPVMVIGRHENIAYQILPTGKFLALFLDALNTEPGADHGPSGATDDTPHPVELPAGLKLYVADQCPHCPKMLLQMQALANSTPMIRLRVINAELFQEGVRNDNIKSVPTLILDDRFRWTGQVTTEEIIKICANRDPSQLSADSLRQLIEDGHAAQVAYMMIESEKVFPVLIDLLTHQRWSVRLGAMVAAEYLADEAPALGLGLCQLLWSDFPDLEPPVQGDVTHIFGLLNDEMTRDYLRTIVKGEYDDEVKEAAEEALAEMEG